MRFADKREDFNLNEREKYSWCLFIGESVLSFRFKASHWEEKKKDKDSEWQHRYILYDVNIVRSLTYRIRT